MEQSKEGYQTRLFTGGLKRDYEELLAFLHICPVGLMDMTADGTVVLVNAMAMKLMLQFAPPPAVTNFFVAMQSVAPELRNLATEFAAPSGLVCENHPIFLGPRAGRHPDEPLVLNCTLLKLDENRLMAAISDISHQSAQQRRLRLAESWIASLLEEAEDFGVMALNDDGVITNVTHALFRLTGFSEEEVVGRGLGLFDTGETGAARPGVADRLALARRNGWFLEEGWHAARDERMWCQMLISVRGTAGFLDSEGSYTAVLRPVRRHEFNTSQLRRMLTTDHLTGAHNRGHFFEVGERECLRAIRYQQELSLIALDVDHFKQLNDGHGHAAGDEALKCIARACMKLLRGPDMFARIGGEEFVILLPATGLDGAVALAERMRQLIEETDIVTAGTTLRCTASFGCAARDEMLRTLPELLAAADAAMYEAKRAGRDRVVAAQVGERRK